MYINDELEQYPFYGVFYKTEVDESLPLDQQVEKEVVICSTPCDIQDSNKKFSGTITAVFAAYFPYDKSYEAKIQRGMMFRGDMFGMEVNGVVHNITYSQMGGAVAYIVDKDI